MSHEAVQESIMAVDETINNLIKELKQERKSHHKVRDQINISSYPFTQWVVVLLLPKTPSRFVENIRQTSSFSSNKF